MHGDLVRAQKLVKKRLIQEVSSAKSTCTYLMGRDYPETCKYTDGERSSNHFKSCQYTYVIGPGFHDITVNQTCSNKTKSEIGGWSTSTMGRCCFAWSQRNSSSTRFCWKDASKFKGATTDSIPGDDGLVNINTLELNFNVNAVHKSRSEESNDVCGGIFVDHASNSSSRREDDKNLIRRRSMKDHSYLTEIDLEKDRTDVDVVNTSSPNPKQFRRTSWSFPTHWLRGRLSNIPWSDLFFPRSFMGKHTYFLLASLFVLWTKLGMARTIFEHVVDTLIQVVLLTLLMTTTVVIFEANDLTVKVANIGKTCMSFLTSPTSNLEVSHHTTESGMSYSDHGNNCGNGDSRQSDDVSQGKEISNLEEKYSQQHGAHPSCQGSVCSQGQKDEGEVEPVQFCEGSTMTEDVLSCLSGLIQTNAQTMTEALFLEGIGTQTDAVCDSDGEKVVFYYTKDEEIFSKEARALDVEVQTELDLKKIYEETEKNKRSHAKSLRSLQRKFLAIRRCCQKKVGEMKRLDMHRGDHLAKLQLQLPALQQEKSSLIAERALIEKQFADEKKKNRDLVNRMTKLNQQFSRLSQGYSSTTTPAIWRQPLKSSSSKLCRSVNDQQQYTQNTYILGQNNSKIPTRQMMLPQSPCNTGSGHGRQMSGTQQQPNKAVQTPLQHPNVVQQPRLPIFQLLHNSILSNTGPDTSGFQLPCHQQLSMSKKYSPLSNHQPTNPALLQTDQNGVTNDCSMNNRISSEATSNS